MVELHVVHVSQVLVLNAVFIDCTERLISWAVCEDDTCNQLYGSEPSPDHTGHHSLMAPVEATLDSLLCTNDLQNLFELAEVLHRVSIPDPQASIATAASRASRVVSV